jgi:hypothetical protein
VNKFKKMGVDITYPLSTFKEINVCNSGEITLNEFCEWIASKTEII